jgi:hypothetical protein
VILKTKILLRVRPKSASAARFPDRAPDEWNLRTDCDDLALRLIAQDAAHARSREVTAAMAITALQRLASADRHDHGRIAALSHRK